MGLDEFSDPIIIPITITIPNPVRRPPSGPFDRGPTFHPSFTDPDWFTRQRPRYTLAQLAMPLPIPPPIVLPKTPDEIAAAMREFKAAVARAKRRAQFAEEEVAWGDYGSAAGHLLGGQPYPADVDDPLGAILHNDAADKADDERPSGRPTLGTRQEEAEDDFGKGDVS